MLKRIFAIGGGELKYRETLEIDKKIVGACHKEHPRVLFIPTASGDADGYVDSFKGVYGEELGCEVDVLHLVNSSLSKMEIREKIEACDILYVGGGNTRKMMEIWKAKEVDTYIREAYQKGKILSGLSAGSICWFMEGHSDSDTLESGEKAPYTVVEGLNIIPLFHCPHHNEGDRAEDFDRMILKRRGIGLAITNHCAVEFEEDRFRVLTSDIMGHAYLVYEDKGEVKREALPVSEAYHPLRYLTEYKSRL